MTATCHPDRKAVAKGLCRQCYDAARRVPPDVRKALEALFRKDAIDGILTRPAPVWGGLAAWKWVENGHSWSDVLGVYREGVRVDWGSAPTFGHLTAPERARAYELLGIGAQVGDPEANAFLKAG